MHALPIFIVDAFAESKFKGNQAAVVLSDQNLTPKQKQIIGSEMNLSETAFPEPQNGDFKSADHFHLRWFTPTSEVPLCGHATLAAAHVLFNEIGNSAEKLTFSTEQAGNLVAIRKEKHRIQLDFPQHSIRSISGFEGVFEKDTTAAMEVINDTIKATVPDGTTITGVALSSHKLLVIQVDSKYAGNLLHQFKPDTTKMLAADPSGVHVEGIILTVDARSASQGKYDYYSRYFGPFVGIPEDPATGSSQSTLGPFWAGIMGKRNFNAFQSYPNRGADFFVEIEGDRTRITGKAHTVLRGTIDPEY